MKNNPRQFELLDSDAAAEPWEEDGLDDRVGFQALAVASGHEFKNTAIQFVRLAGAEPVRLKDSIDGFGIDARIRGRNGREFLLLARGTPDDHGTSGLRKIDTVQKVGFMAMQLRRRTTTPILIVTSDLPGRDSTAGRYLAALSDDVFDVVAVRNDLRGYQRLAESMTGESVLPPSGRWRAPIVLEADQGTSAPESTDTQGSGLGLPARSIAQSKTSRAINRPIERRPMQRPRAAPEQAASRTLF